MAGAAPGRRQAPRRIIFEVKTLRGRHPGLAVREAVGQLLEYRHFVGPQGAELCILLDAEPTAEVVAYVEQELGMLVGWWCGVSLSAGPRSRDRLLTS